MGYGARERPPCLVTPLSPFPCSLIPLPARFESWVALGARPHVPQYDDSRGSAARSGRHGRRRPGHLRRHGHETTVRARSGACTTIAFSRGLPAPPPIRLRCSRGSNPSSNSTAASWSALPSNWRKTGVPIASLRRLEAMLVVMDQAAALSPVGHRRPDRARRWHRGHWLGRTVRGGCGQGACGAQPTRSARDRRTRHGDRGVDLHLHERQHRRRGALRAMSISLPERSPSAVESLTPRQIVAELDKYVVGQHKAKRAVAIALRNRMRRQKLAPDMADEVAPKNILMIGPTGVGKTEIARRLARLAQSPFIKVEASKFTEVGYVGRDVESMVRDLVELAIDMVREERRADVRREGAAAGGRTAARPAASACHARGRRRSGGGGAPRSRASHARAAARTVSRGPPRSAGRSKSSRANNRSRHSRSSPAHRSKRSAST